MTTRNFAFSFPGLLRRFDESVVKETSSLTQRGEWMRRGRGRKVRSLMRSSGNEELPSCRVSRPFVPGDRVILFDGVCNLCNFWVDFVIRRDSSGYFRFAALQSSVGDALLGRYNGPRDLSTLVFLDENGMVHVKSEAVLCIGEHVHGFQSMSWMVRRLVPLPLRDWIYTYLVAQPRYRVFGKRSSCRVEQNREILWRFLDEDNH